MSVRVELNKAQYLQALCPVTITEQLSTELDGGDLKYLITEPKTEGVQAPLSQYTVTVTDTTGATETFQFVGTDTRALIAATDANNGVYKHSVSLTEASKFLQGIMIDGLAVSQPEEESERSNLLTVVNRLLAVTPFDNSRSAVRFTLDLTGNAYYGYLMLVNTVSPQFRWNTQTTLWECLVQVGAVIDAIPRITADANGNFTEIAFDLINTYDYEVQDLYDGADNAEGDSVEEGQYNTALSAIVENLMEE